MKLWYVGWKEIAKAVGRCEKTVMEYAKKYGLPIRRGPKNNPYCLPHELQDWLIKFDQKKRRIKSSKNYCDLP